MKLLEFEISNVRGVSHLLLRPAGHNIVISGPNGSGKSSIIDSIDFLLTGNITRLTGAGTKNITLKKHGKHVDAKLEDSFVRARVKLVNNKEVEIKRSLLNPEKLECDEGVRSQIEDVLSLARLGQHILTRRELLKYITSKPGERAEQIQSLLNLSQVEVARKSLGKVQGDLEKNLKNAQGGISAVEGQINSIVGIMSFDKEVVLKFVNQNRILLGAEPITSLNSSHIKSNIAFSIKASEEGFTNPSIIEGDIANLKKALTSETRQNIANLDRTLRSDLATIRDNSVLSHALKHQRLATLGLELLDETGWCPLCDTPWPLGELKQRLENQILNAEEAQKYEGRIAQGTKTISDIVSFATASLKKIIAAIDNMPSQTIVGTLKRWQNNLIRLTDAISKGNYLDENLDEEKVHTLFSPIDVSQILNEAQKIVSEAYPSVSPEQTAYNRLTQLELALSTWEKEYKTYATAKSASERATKLEFVFLKSRDEILGKLYGEIKTRFEQLYRQLHQEDEGDFSALLEPDGAGLNLEVDFHGRGMHPPHALHSEGHQDSMGVCLFLALSERLTQNRMKLIILDDVVMSVDAGHRKELCRVLATTFKDNQLLIATHDRTWYNQLKGAKVVDKNGTYELYGWHIATGPKINTEIDVWDRIYKDLDENNITSASGKLRRWAEEFFREMCDNLAAQVMFRLDGQYVLGDFLPAVVSQYDKWLNSAIKSAESWKKEELKVYLTDQINMKKSIYSRIEADQWEVNATIHYNNWENLSVSEFRPLVNAFKDLYSLFVCPDCNQLLRLDKKISPESMRCDCGNISWNLVKRKP
ncbi:MAG: AAA family ATPase [Anaerolineae bacterium]|nr:AAA family ATPase [Anaerolineae bacterium]